MGPNSRTTEECGSYCSPIRRHLRPTFRRFFRHPISRVRVELLSLLLSSRLDAFLMSSQLGKEGGRGAGGGGRRRTCGCVALLRFERPGACRRCFRFISRCSRDRSLSRHSCGCRLSTRVTRRRPLPAWALTSDLVARSVSSSCFFFFYFITLDVTLPRETHSMEK